MRQNFAERARANVTNLVLCDTAVFDKTPASVQNRSIGILLEGLS